MRGSRVGRLGCRMGWMAEERRVGRLTRNLTLSLTEGMSRAGWLILLGWREGMSRAVWVNLGWRERMSRAGWLTLSWREGKCRAGRQSPGWKGGVTGKVGILLR